MDTIIAVLDEGRFSIDVVFGFFSKFLHCPIRQSSSARLAFHGSEMIKVPRRSKFWLIQSMLVAVAVLLALALFPVNKDFDQGPTKKIND
jgi:hypothetical protein